MSGTMRLTVARTLAGEGGHSMGARPRSLARCLAVAAIVLLVAVATAPQLGLAATADDVQAGKALRTVIPGIAAANCPTVGTSLAVVQGSKVDFPQYPILLVTSCFSTKVTDRSILYFLNPGKVDNDPDTGKVVKTIQTLKASKAYAPGNGWAELVLAPDKGVLFGCGSNGELYTIDYSVFTTTADGTLTAVPRPVAVTSCSGLAWDPSNKTIYQSTGSTIYRFDTAGTLKGSFPAPANCTVSGLSVVGGVLIVGCNGNATVQRLDKISGLPTADHPTIAFNGGALSDLECDPVTFAKVNIDAVWGKIVATNLLQAFRVPGGTCGLPPTTTVFAPAACPDPPSGTVDKYRQDVGNILAVPRDTDGDGLWDCWEDPARWGDNLPGIDFDGDGNRDLVLCVGTECADPNFKDIFVEIDYMGPGPTHPQGHLPDPVALANLRAAFADAPVDPLPPGCVIGQTCTSSGIRLHFQVDDAIPHTDHLALEPCTGPAGSGDADFDMLKSTWFGTASERANPKTVLAKRFAFRYMVFGHNLVGVGNSGCSEIPGDDSAITLANFGPTDPTDPYYQRGTTDEQAGTVMHELGHNLGLRHGGGDNINCKPNYLSVMNYSRQLPDFLTNRPLDYSRGLLPPLSETSGLSETLGIGTLSSFPFIDGDKTVYSAANTLTMLVQPLGHVCDPVAGTCVPVPQGTAIDWNHNGSYSDSGVVADVNKYPKAGCDGAGTELVGFDDWQNLQYNARASIDFGAGARSANAVEHRDKDSQQSQESFNAADRDGDGVPDAFGCSSNSVPCVIDIKPGTKPKVLSKGNEANVQVAIRSSATFDAVKMVIRETLTLNEVGVKVNSQGKGTCSSVTSTQGRQDLLCQFPAAALDLGGNFAILEGKACVSKTNCGILTTIRARDFITVVK
jgi:hypothetical protein